MLEYIYTWIENITFYMVIMVAVIHMVPGESYKKYIRFFVGLILILMLANPILKIWGLAENTKMEYEKQLQEMKEVMSDGDYISGFVTEEK